MTQSDIAAAYLFAAMAHAGGRRRGTAKRKTPYINHICEVADLVASHGGNDTAIIAAVLHDTIEESETTLDMISERFGTEVASIVDELTNKPEWEELSSTERKAEQAKHIAQASDEAKLIKIADQTSNVAAMAADPKAFKASKIRQYTQSAAKVVAACGDICPSLTAEFGRAALMAHHAIGDRK